MPSTYAHRRFGQDVLAALDAPHRSRAAADPDLFQIGLHGPDLLFYYKPFSHHALHAEGARMHRLSGEEYFAACGSTFLERGPRKSEYSYLCGFLCHYALDRACHGYINTLAAAGDVSHEEIESEFDRILLEEDGLDPVRTNTASNIRPSARAARAVSPYFPGTSEEEILAGIRSFVTFNRLLALPGRIAYRPIDALLRHLPAYPLIHGHMINLDPKPLCEESNADLRRLYEEAVPDACLFIRSFLPAVRGEIPWPAEMQDNFEGLLHNE